MQVFKHAEKLISFAAVFLSISSFGSAFEPMGKWNHENVRVCWLTPELFRDHPEIVDDQVLDEKDHIASSPRLSEALQSTIEKNFTPLKTGIHFTGWNECVVNQSGKLLNADAVIAFDSVEKFTGVIEGESSVGYSVSRIMEPMVRRAKNSISVPTVVIHLPPFSSYTNQNISYENSVLLSGIHEFGHLAGLHHEHMAFMNEALNDSECTTSEFGPYFKNMVETNRKSYSADYLKYNFEIQASQKSSYDSNSIMSYCQLFQTMENGFDFYATPAVGKAGYFIHGSHILKLDDSTLYTLTASPSTQDPKRVLVHSNIGLSAQDNAMLISIYSKKN